MNDPMADMPQWEKDLARDMERFDRAAARRCGGCGKTSHEIASEAVRTEVSA